MKNVTFKMKDVKVLVDDAIKNVSKDNWKAAIRHTKKVENAFRKVDFCDIEIEQVVIHLSDSDGDSSLESEVEDSDNCEE